MRRKYLLILGIVLVALVVSSGAYAGSSMSWDFSSPQDRQVDWQIAQVLYFGNPFPTQYMDYYIYSYDDSRPVIGTQSNTDPVYGYGSSSTDVYIQGGDGDSEFLPEVIVDNYNTE